MKKTRITQKLILGMMTVLPLLAQENLRSTAVVQYFGNFQARTADRGLTHDASSSGGVLASYRYAFTRHQAIETTYGYTLNTQRYALGADRSSLRTHAHEATAAYVLRMPLRGWTPYVLAGTGAVVFSPDLSGFDAQARAVFVYGVGADFEFSRRWLIRAQYRGLVYNSPIIGVATVASERLTHAAQPSIGIGFRF